MGKRNEYEQRAVDEIEAAPCKGSLERGDQCEMDGRCRAECWRHYNRYDLAAGLAARRLRAAGLCPECGCEFADNGACVDCEDAVEVDGDEADALERAA